MSVKADTWRLADIPDQVQLLYATPHRWTPFYDSVETRRVIQSDTRRWDYKHQVLENPHIPTWRVFLWFKTIEAMVRQAPTQYLWIHRRFKGLTPDYPDYYRRRSG